MTTARWTAALDDLERTLAVQRAAVDAGRPEDVVAFVPPAELGPLPAALTARAVRLAQSAQELVARLQALTAGTQQELALLDRMRPSASGPSYVDHAM